MKGSRPITKENCQKLLHTNNSNLTTRSRALLTLGFTTGYRISELLSIQVQDLAQVHPITKKVTMHSHVRVHARNTKTKTGRSVLLNTQARLAITHLIEELVATMPSRPDLLTIEETPLFVGRKSSATSSAISRQQAHRILKALFATVGELGNVATHSLRKTFALAIYSATNKLEMVQIALGHKSISSTVSYLAFDNQVVDDAINGMVF